MPGAAGPVIGRFCSAVDAGLRAIDLTLVTTAAEHAANAVLAGGRLFATGSEDFVSEAVVRGGGLMMVQALGDSVCRPGDAVLVGWTLGSGTAQQRCSDPELAVLLRSLSSTGALVVGIGPAESVGEVPRGSTAAGRWFHLNSCAPGLDGVADILADRHPYALHSLQNIALLWALTAELTAALTRHGEMPVFYQSVLVEGARKRNATHQAASMAKDRLSTQRVKGNAGPTKFEASHTVPPQPVGVLGGRYLAELRARLAALAAGATEPVAKAVALCVDARSRGHTLHTYLIGHFPVHQSGQPGDPKVLSVLTDGRHGELPSEEVREPMSSSSVAYYERSIITLPLRLRMRATADDEMSACSGIANESKARRCVLPCGVLQKAESVLRDL